MSGAELTISLSLTTLLAIFSILWNIGQKYWGDVAKQNKRMNNMELAFTQKFSEMQAMMDKRFNGFDVRLGGVETKIDPFWDVLCKNLPELLLHKDEKGEKYRNNPGNSNK